MNESRSHKDGYGPATATISQVTCVLDGTGMARLQAVVTVIRTAQETIESVEVLVGGLSSGNPPSERMGSPDLLQNGQWQHTYDWYEIVPCAATYSVQAIAQVAQYTTAASATVNHDCPPCPEAE